MKSVIQPKNISLPDTTTLLMWGTFFSAFLFPPLFLLFLWLAARVLWREMKKEYGEAFSYMKKESIDTLVQIESRLPAMERKGRAVALPLA